MTDYYEQAGLSRTSTQLGFHMVGYGCTTCIGNSGPLPPEISDRDDEHGLAVVAVLSGNRNFEGRIHRDVRMNYLASPPLVVAYALAGTMDIDLAHDPLGHDADGEPVYLRDIWPTSSRDRRRVDGRGAAGDVRGRHTRTISDGDERWRALRTHRPACVTTWDAQTRPTSAARRSSMPLTAGGATAHATSSAPERWPCSATASRPITSRRRDRSGGRSGRCAVAASSTASRPREFNSYGSRRGNHEVMIRGTFANVRLRNRLAPGTEGGVTVHLPDREQMTIFDAAMRYPAEGVPLVVLAGKEYGSGSSRDWAAKGSFLLGVRAVLAESFERIHRSNLVGMGVLPLEFEPGESAASLGLSGEEVFTIRGMDGLDRPPAHVSVIADDREFTARVRIDTPREAEYYRHGGILHYVLRHLASGDRASTMG